MLVYRGRREKVRQVGAQLVALHLRLAAVNRLVVLTAVDGGALDVRHLRDRNAALAPVDDHLRDNTEAPGKLRQAYGVDCFVDRRLVHLVRILNTVFRNMQTACLGTAPYTSPLMGKPKARPELISHLPLFRWFEADKKNRAKLRDAGYTDGRITNWKRRAGIPRAEIADVAAIMGLSYEDYLLEAGAAPNSVHQARASYVVGDDTLELLQGYTKAQPSWQLALRLLAPLPPEQQPKLWDAINKVLVGTGPREEITRVPLENSRHETKSPVEERKAKPRTR